MKEKKVTIIVPVYNAEENIRFCLDSILNQTAKNFKVLLINDGSTDNSLKIINDYANKYPDIFKVLTQKNKGVVATRHRGIYEADTEYIMFLDNDDFIDRDYVEVHFNEIEKNNCDIVISGYRRATLTETIFEVHAKNSDWTKYAINAPWARIFRRSLIVENNIEFLDTAIGEDTFFNLKCYIYTNKIKYIDYIGYNWFYNKESVSNSKQKGLRKECDMLVLMNNLYELYQNRMDDIFQYFMIRYIIWYLLFSGASASSSRFMEEYRRLFEWLKNNNIKLKIKWFSRKIQSEPIKNRIIISIFYWLSKLKLIKVFSKLYCKG